MKKIFLLLLVTVFIALIYSYLRSGENELAKNHGNLTLSNDLIRNNITGLFQTGAEREAEMSQKSSVGRPGIIIILTYDKSKPGGPTSFLQVLLSNNTQQGGC